MCFGRPHRHPERQLPRIVAQCKSGVIPSGARDPPPKGIPRSARNDTPVAGARRAPYPFAARVHEDFFSRPGVPWRPASIVELDVFLLHACTMELRIPFATLLKIALALL